MKTRLSNYIADPVDRAHLWVTVGLAAAYYTLLAVAALLDLAVKGAFTVPPWLTTVLTAAGPPIVLLLHELIAIIGAARPQPVNPPSPAPGPVVPPVPPAPAA